MEAQQMNLLDLTGILMCGGGSPPAPVARVAPPPPPPPPAPRKQPQKTVSKKPGDASSGASTPGPGSSFGGTLLTGTQGIGDSNINIGASLLG
tara:strand:+ start:209 stop:487 length:279 start_codon:yes stop_codon:yes gene_type:complete